MFYEGYDAKFARMKMRVPQKIWLVKPWHYDSWQVAGQDEPEDSPNEKAQYILVDSLPVERIRKCLELQNYEDGDEIDNWLGCERVLRDILEAIDD